MHLQDYIRIARQNLVLLGVLVILGCSGGLVASLVQTPMYQASIQAYVSAEQATNLSDVAQGAQYAQQAVKGYAAVVDTPLVLQPVVDQLNLDMSVAALQKEIVASAPIDTPVLDISVTDRSPSRAASIANAVGQSLADVVTTLTPPTANSVAPVKITVVQEATVPTDPAIPNTRMNILIGLLVGVALAVLIALFRNALERRADEDDEADADADEYELVNRPFDLERPQRPRAHRPERRRYRSAQPDR